MRKKTLFFTALLGMAVFFNSCEKEITSTAVVVDESKNAVLKLYVKADLDTLPELKNVPDGTSFNISVKKSDLNDGYTGSGRWTVTEGTTGGVLEVTVPVTDDGVDVYVDAVTFEATYVGSTFTQKRKFEYVNTFGGIKTGSNNVYSITMDYSVLETINN